MARNSWNTVEKLDPRGFRGLTGFALSLMLIPVIAGAGRQRVAVRPPTCMTLGPLLRSKPKV
jgi:hypothetical protein